jgi:hypothetical protein
MMEKAYAQYESLYVNQHAASELVAQPIPRLRPACLPHEHPGGLKATGTIERRMRDGDQPPPKRKKIRRRRRRDNHDDD